MMRSAWRLLSTEVRGLQAAVYILAFSALLSSLLALVRDRLFASHFGAGIELDLYYAAFRIPDLIFVATGALVSVYVLIPQLAKRDTGEQMKYIDTILVGFSALAILVSGFAMLLAPRVLALLFPGYEESGHLPLLVDLTRVMLIQPIALGFSNILAAITQARQRYALYAISPLLYNLGIIIGLLGLYPVFGFVGLAWGVVLGAVLHCAVQIPSIWRDGYFRSIPRLYDPRALVATALISLPRAMTLSMNQVVFLGLTAIASTLVAGSIAVFIFAYNLQAVPLAIIGASYSVAAFPRLAQALSAGHVREFVFHIATAARYILFWSLPASALILVLRAHMVRVILGAGEFDWTDTRLTAASFALMALALASQGLMLLLVRGYYAAGKTFVPFTMALVSAVATIIGALFLIEAFKQPGVFTHLQTILRLEDVPGTSVLALAVSYALVSMVSTIALAVHFEFRFGGFFAEVRETLWQSALAAVGAGCAAYIVLSALEPLSVSSTLLSILMRGAAAGLTGVAVAALVYALVQSREFAETITGLRARLWREEIMPAQAASSAEEMTVSSPQ